jgi:hypothetical protein
MTPTALQTKQAAAMTNEQLAKALRTTCEALKEGKGSPTLAATRWKNLAALKADSTRRQW